ncbi:unnamed protein product [Caenorhabditis auriculariae]|uniref:Nuclear receptor domain-containing protein n=1 Tax=Caenorhabditis auriculariae TaxID=2777116 RepID=A0A8S1H6M3_9PELO|nr:unnamed protein product [Caenorhabditis auriculariae]
MDISCSICNNQCRGNNFGVPSCRACAAFFRRTVTENRNYRCRKSFRCVISSEEKKMCKACRYNKCLAVGMKRTAVLKKEGSSPVTSNSPCCSIENKSSTPLCEKNTPTLLALLRNYEVLIKSRRAFFSAIEKWPERERGKSLKGHSFHQNEADPRS